MWFRLDSEVERLPVVVPGGLIDTKWLWQSRKVVHCPQGIPRRCWTVYP